MVLTLTEFEPTQPFPVRFLTQTLRAERLAHAYLLEGHDITTMYCMVFRLAQLINCLEKQSLLEACGHCQPCQWISDNAHPGVMTISNLTYLAEESTKSRSTKPQQSIKVEQLERLLHSIQLHSGGFKRVVILTGAGENTATEHGDTPGLPPPKDWQPQIEGGAFELLPLDRSLFPERLANKFLKTLEEPPRDVIFFLLTDAREKLLDTIVSRCQRIPFQLPPDFYRSPLQALEQDALANFLSYWQTSGHYLDVMERFAALMTEQGYDAETACHRLQYCLFQQLHHPSLTSPVFQSLSQQLTALAHARRMLQAHVREESVLEDLFLEEACT